MQQLDAIHRELWWVITGTTRVPQESTVFGRLARAVQTQLLKEPLARKFGRYCENYQIVRQKKTRREFPQRWAFFERCPTLGSEEFAVIELIDSDRWRVSFRPHLLSKSLGLIASVSSRNIDCEVSFIKGDQKVRKLSCPGWHQDLGPERVLVLDSYEFNFDQPIMAKAKGNIVKEFNPIETFSMSVPKKGTITVERVELPNPFGTPTNGVGATAVGAHAGAAPPGVQIIKAADHKDAKTASGGRFAEAKSATETSTKDGADSETQDDDSAVVVDGSDEDSENLSELQGLHFSDEAEFDAFLYDEGIDPSIVGGEWVNGKWVPEEPPYDENYQADQEPQINTEEVATEEEGDVAEGESADPRGVDPSGAVARPQDPGRGGEFPENAPPPIAPPGHGRATPPGQKYAEPPGQKYANPEEGEQGANSAGAGGVRGIRTGPSRSTTPVLPPPDYIENEE